jgi:hypothetical protein
MWRDLAVAMTTAVVPISRRVDEPEDHRSAGATSAEVHFEPAMCHLPVRRALSTLVLLLALLPWGAAAQPVRVASKIDTEGALLGQLMLQTLQGAGIATVDRLQLGNTQIVRRALLAGEVDL